MWFEKENAAIRLRIKINKKNMSDGKEITYQSSSIRQIHPRNYGGTRNVRMQDLANC